MNDITPSQIRDSMLKWYDKYSRSLPWRSKPHKRPDPYHVWLSEIMLQQTTVRAVIPYFEKFITIWPTVHALANASQEDVLREWAGLGYYSRARNLHKCAQVIVNEYNGRFPDDINTLKKLPGIGDYTSAAITSIAFDIPASVIDGNVERVISRLYRVSEPLPLSKNLIRNYAHNLFLGNNQNRPSCFAQSLMDLGATICTPLSPKCSLCPISEFCQGFAKNDAEIYPLKLKKKKTPEKHAICYIYCDKNKVSIEKRHEKGMLGGMIGFPTTEWIDISEKIDEKFNKNIKIKHVFTHFSLILYPVIVCKETELMIDKSELDDIGLPTLFKKVWNLIKSEI